jgi:hypothetical protein
MTDEGKEFWVFTSQADTEPTATLWWVDDNGAWVSAPVPPPRLTPVHGRWKNDDGMAGY